ncbi:MAG: ACT domain-containing protein [Proteobacteria bacterium]|nr:ACT domain-containing protein [Pseudomonadota bacterium]
MTVRVEAFDRPGLLRDVAAVVAEEKLNITGSQVTVDAHEGIATIMTTVELGSLAQLSRLLTRLESIKAVRNASRETRGNGVQVPAGLRDRVN